MRGDLQDSEQIQNKAQHPGREGLHGPSRGSQRKEHSADPNARAHAGKIKLSA